MTRAAPLLPVVFRIPVTRQAQDVVSVLAGTCSLEDPREGGDQVVWRWSKKRTGQLILNLTRVPGLSISSLDDANVFTQMLARDGLLLLLSLHRLLHQEGYPDHLVAEPAHLVGSTRWMAAVRRQGRPAVCTHVQGCLRAAGALTMTWDHNGCDDMRPLVGWDPARGRMSLPEPLRPDGRRRRFTWVPEALLEVPPRTLGLGVHLLLHYANSHARLRDHESVRLKTSTLWNWAAIRQGRDTPRSRWAAATDALTSQLVALHEVGIVKGWSSLKPTAGAVCEVSPPDWWMAARAGSATLPTVSLAGTPRDGPGLRNWRVSHGLKQRDVANIVGVSQASVSKAEHRDALPREWRCRLCDHSRSR